ncbi:MAG: hypothetical protein ACYTGX_05990, partial [Planctomycetota bacterium]
MTDPAPAAPKPSSPGPPPKSDLPDKVVIHPLPKAVVLYPTAVLCVIFGFIALPFEAGQEPALMGLSFVALFGLNLFIMNFEFGRASTLAIFAMVFGLVFLGLFLGERYQWPVFSGITGFFKTLEIHANSSFYFSMAVILGVTFFFVFLKTRFNYWEFTSNELLHHHGLVGNIERFPAPNLRISKEIHDVFEFMLLRSGRLVVHPAGERRSFVLELVAGVNQKEEQIKRLLSKLQVDIDHDHDLH